MHNLIIGFIIGIIFCIVMYPRKEKEPNLVNININNLINKGSIVCSLTNKLAFHMHHWMFSLLLLSILNHYKQNNNLLEGFLLILLFHGLSYKDCFEILVKNPY